MSNDWLEIYDENISVAEIMQRIRERIVRRDGLPQSEDPAAIADTLWRETIEGETILSGPVPIRRRDCDIVPRHYAIEWRIPILGPIHAVVRRIINDEIRRYLMPSLRKQSDLNRRVLQLLSDLMEENRRLGQRIEELENRARGAQQ